MSRVVGRILAGFLLIQAASALQNRAYEGSMNSVYHEIGVNPVQRQSQPRCQLLNDAFDYAIQGVLGLLAFASLLVKFYYFDKKKGRAARAFTMDSSKQAVSGIAMHFLNIFLAKLLVFEGGSTSADECDVYFVNFLVDIVLGMALVWALLIPYNAAARRYGFRARTCGDYGESDEWLPFILQLTGFTALMFAVKLFLSAVEYGFAKQIDWLGHAMFYYLDAFPRIKLLVIMVAAPFFCNVLFFWIIDHIISDKKDEDAVLEADAVAVPVDPRYIRRKILAKDDAETYENLLEAEAAEIEPDF